MMLLIRAAELFAAIGGVILLLSQVIWPGLIGEPLFPMFRSKNERRKQAEADAELNRRIDRVEDQVRAQARADERISQLEQRLSGVPNRSETDEPDQTETDDNDTGKTV